MTPSPLEHNLGGSQVALVTGTCDCGPDTNLAAPPPGEYVRVTVCVPLSNVMPNLIANFGFDVSDPERFAECTTVMLHE